MKKVMKNKVESTVGVGDVLTDKIYVAKFSNNYYKAHRVQSKWAWIDLGSSDCYANGTYDSFGEIITKTIDFRTVWEFDSLKDFAEWLNSGVLK